MKLLTLGICFFFSSLAAFAQHKNAFNPGFKVVGYYFLHPAATDNTNLNEDLYFLPYITHLNIAFINPDSVGNFDLHYPISLLVSRCHERNVKVLMSIAGGGPHPYYLTLLNTQNRKAFIDNLINCLLYYNLDGVDIDLEGNDINENYEAFAIELHAKLKPLNKLLTAAIATTYKDRLSDKALHQFDFINIMSYDRTGPWNPGNPGHHSPYSMAVEDLDYWHNSRHIPKNKINLGLPFYGYGFSTSDSIVIGMEYKQIVASYPDSLLSDTLLLPGGRVLYYNNMETINKKTLLALKNAGGVMIWQVAADVEDDKSLLKSIHQVIIKSK